MGADLRERGQQNLRDIHFDITFNLIHKILKAAPWAHSPVRLYDHLVWAAKHVSPADAKRITQLLSFHFQGEFKSLKDTSPEPDMLPGPKSLKSYLHSMQITLEGFVRARRGAVGEEALASNALYALEGIAGACSDHHRLQVFVEWVC